MAKELSPGLSMSAPRWKNAKFYLLYGFITSTCVDESELEGEV